MRFGRSLGLLALFAVSFSVGCSMTNPTVRSQSPDNAGPIIGAAPGYGDFQKTPYLGRHDRHDFKPYAQFRDANFGYEGDYYAGRDRYVTDANVPYTLSPAAAGPMAAGRTGQGAMVACPDCNNGQNCPQSGCRRCGRGCNQGCPQHYQTYQYNWPQNMVYPQQGVPSGIVQYPYYTLRGPTDFFMN